MKAFFHKAASLTLLAGGIALLIYGIKAASTLASGISRYFTGFPTGQSMWMLVGGMIAAITGFVWALRAWKLTLIP